MCCFDDTVAGNDVDESLIHCTRIPVYLSVACRGG